VAAILDHLEAGVRQVVFVTGRAAEQVMLSLRVRMTS